MAHPKTRYLAAAIQREWGSIKPDRKVERYIGQFFDQERVGSRIHAKVVGNHGTYTVSITVRDGEVVSACSFISANTASATTSRHWRKPSSTIPTRL